MEWLKKWLNRVFIDGLSGMALGLFSTLIVGTIIQQVGTLIGGQVGEITYLAGKMAAAMTSAGIGVGVAYKFKEPPLVVLSAATAGMAGGFASKILAGTVLVDGENRWVRLLLHMWLLKPDIWFLARRKWTFW